MAKLSTPGFTPHETKLLDKAQPFAQQVLADKGRYPTREELKRHLHCASESAQNILLHLSRTAVIATPDVTTEFLVKENARLNRTVSKVRLELNSERRMRRNLSENHAGYDELLAGVKDFVEALGDFPSPVKHIKAAKPKAMPPVGNDHSEDAVLVISDTHFGDVIRREDTSGFPEFDLVIAGNRLGYIAEKAKQILGLHRAMYPIKRLYVPILGDIGNGVLHDSPNSNELFVPAQVHFSYHMLRFLIEDLLTLIPAGIVEEIVLLFSVGNHMRMDIHMPHKHQAQRTFDWLIYQFLIDKFKGVPGISIREEMSPFIFEEIRGHRYLFTHGVQVGYHNKPEAQFKSVSGFINGIRSLFDSPEYRKATGLEGETFSRAVIGDVHIPTRFPRLLSNGSLNGQNELGTNWMLEPIPAGQWLFGVSNRHQETWSYYLDCSHIQRETPNGYALFAREYEAKFAR